MKIQIVKIPNEGCDLEFTVDRQWLMEGLKPSDELRKYIGGDMKCKCRLTILHDEIFMKGEVTLSLNPTCFRCDREYEETYSTNIDLTCLPDDQKKADRGVDYMDGDVGLNYYRGDELDLAKIAREQLFLTMPITFICNPDCRGLCPICGLNLNEGECTCKGENLKELKN